MHFYRSTCALHCCKKSTKKQKVFTKLRQTQRHSLFNFSISLCILQLKFYILSSELQTNSHSIKETNLSGKVIYFHFTLYFFSFFVRAVVLPNDVPAQEDAVVLRRRMCNLSGSVECCQITRISGNQSISFSFFIVIFSFSFLPFHSFQIAASLYFRKKLAACQQPPKECIEAIVS